MAKKYDHLDLPEIEKTYVKKKKQGFGAYTLEKRDHKKFAKEQISILNMLAKKSKKEVFADYSQELVLKIKTNYNVHDDTFRKNLNSVGCETLISEKKSKNSWIISTADSDFKKLKKKLTDRGNRKNPNFIDSIEHFQDFTFEDKIGPLLKKNPLGRIEVNKIVLSLVHKESDTDNEKINSAVETIIIMAEKDGFAVHDKLITANVCLVLLECNETFLRKISALDLISGIDRPAQFKLEQGISADLEDTGNNTPPSLDNHGILVMDSGIKLHPLLVDAVNPEGMIGLPDRNINDDRAHGTKVAGVALHGDIQNKISTGFRSEIWIYSAKIFYQDGNITIPIDEKVVETNIKQNIMEILKKYPKCKIINLSFGKTYNIPDDTSKQFDLASVIDDLSIQYKDNDVIFVISNGNIDINYCRENKYPNYLLGTNSEIRLNDPATSAHAISVGALQDFDPQMDQPSSITRIGPGINDMLKPELVETGGGFNKGIMLLNPDFQNRLFTIGMGTSFSAPKIAHYLALLFNKYPQHHRNLIMCFLLSSTNFPASMPKEFPKLNSSIKNSNLKTLLNIYGYGKPEITNALHTSDDRVVFKFEGSIELNRIKYFPINIPDKFVSEPGKRYLSVTLVYDPPTRKNRSDYLGVCMDFHLYKNTSVDTIMKKFNEIELGTDNSDQEIENILTNLAKYEIKLNPGIAIRKKTPHQHGKRTLTTSSRLNDEYPLILVVFGQKKWDNLKIDNQDFAVVVTLEHENKIDLYNQIKIKNNIDIHTQIKI